MINPITELLAYLNLQEPLTDLTTDFYGGVMYPPKEYIPGTRAITFNTRGGTFNYDGTIRSESIGFKCYGANEVDAYTLSETLIDVLHDKHYGKIMGAEVQVTTILQQEPEVLWWFALVYFLIQFKAK